MQKIAQLFKANANKTVSHMPAIFKSIAMERLTATFSIFPRVFWLPCTLLLLYSNQVAAQCNTLITTPIGSTQKFGCTKVHVTSDGSAFMTLPTYCNGIKYSIGRDGDGSVTFDFSTPVLGVSLGMMTFDHFEWYEEVSIEINGAQIFIPAPTTPNCMPSQVLAIVTPGGNLAAPLNTYAGFEDLVIMQSIKTIKITDTWLSGTPLGVLFSMHVCLNPCAVDAGNLTGGPMFLCPQTTATVATSAQSCLSSNQDIVQYVLCSDTINPLGSIVAVNGLPSFAFNPQIMQPNVFYYIEAVAGNNSNGAIDLTDPCLDFSNPVPVLWYPSPTASLSVDSPDICDGSCTTINVNFTGSPPFQLNYTTSNLASGSVLFPDQTGSFIVCAPNNSPPNLTVTATSVTDAHCTCN